MIQETNTSIKHSGLSNQPGLAWVKAVAIEGINAIDWFNVFMQTGSNVETASYTSIGLNAGFSWIDIASDFPSPFVLTESEREENPQGHIFSYTVQQSIPQDDLVTRGQILRFYSRTEWVLVCKATNGTLRIIGGANGKGAKFTRAYTTGDQAKGTSMQILKFTWESPEAAL